MCHCATKEYLDGMPSGRPTFHFDVGSWMFFDRNFIFILNDEHNYMFEFPLSNGSLIK